MRSINNRYYFDYNATSPLAESVKDWLSKGDFPFANPASIHHSGKIARRLMNDVRESIYLSFNLNDQSHDLYFHSGATEGIGNIIRGFFESHPSAAFAYTSTDHSCVFEHAKLLEKNGVTVIEMAVDSNGNLETKSLEKLKQLSVPVLLNWTWVNNETGVVWPLEDALKLKQQLKQCYVHVDAVQAPGKVENYAKLISQLDAYTFSGHKFGALKGIGFSFVANDFEFNSIVLGGGQQGGRRSGTENTYGAYSIKLALEELNGKYNSARSRECLDIIKDEILNALGDRGELVAGEANYRNTNTLYIVFYHVKSDITSVAFDLAGMDVSTGSACSSGAIVPSRVLLNMGHDEVRAKSAIRFSFAPEITIDQAKEYSSKIAAIVNRFNQK